MRSRKSIAKTACVLGLGLLIVRGAHAIISMNYQFVEPSGSDGGSIPVDSIGVLVVSLNDAEFGAGSDLLGLPLANGQTFAGDDLILSTFQASDLGGGLVGFAGATSIDPSLTPGLDAGDPLMFYFFPTETVLGGTVDADAPYGSFRSDVPVSGSTTAFVLPSDPSTHNLNVNTTSVNGDVLDSLLQANAVVPEPSSSLFTLFGGIALALRRRR